VAKGVVEKEGSGRATSSVVLGVRVGVRDTRGIQFREFIESSIDTPGGLSMG